MMRGSVAGGQSWRETSHSRHMNASPNSVNGLRFLPIFLSRRAFPPALDHDSDPYGSMASVRLLLPVVIMSLCTRSRGAKASLTAHGALPVVLRLRGGVTGNELRARAAQLRRREPRAPEPQQAEAVCDADESSGAGDDSSSTEGGDDARWGVEERHGELHCRLRGAPVAISLAELEAPIDDWEGAPSLLFVAAAEGHVPLLRALVAHGADMTRVNDDEDTALHVAAYHGHVKTINCLCSAGVPVSATNNHGATALHAAAFGGRGRAACALLACGASAEATDAHGMTAADIAEALGHARATYS